MNVEIIILSMQLAVMTNGDKLPVTNWFDDCGEECEPNDAVWCVAGPDHEGYWYTIDLKPSDSFH